MFTRGYAKHPCAQFVCSQGFAVRPSQRYARIGRIANRCEYIGYVQGCYGETLVDVSKPLVHLWNRIPCHPNLSIVTELTTVFSSQPTRRFPSEALLSSQIVW